MHLERCVQFHPGGMPRTGYRQKRAPQRTAYLFVCDRTHVVPAFALFHANARDATDLRHRRRAFPGNRHHNAFRNRRSWHHFADHHLCCRHARADGFQSGQKHDDSHDHRPIPADIPVDFFRQLLHLGQGGFCQEFYHLPLGHGQYVHHRTIQQPADDDVVEDYGQIPGYHRRGRATVT